MAFYIARKGKKVYPNKDSKSCAHHVAYAMKKKDNELGDFSLCIAYVVGRKKYPVLIPNHLWVIAI